MRRLLVLAFAAAFSSACTEEDPPPLYLEVDYQVRCFDCQPVAPDDAVRRVQALDAQDGFRVECNVAERSGGRLLSFTAAYTDAEASRNNYSFGVFQANLDEANPGSACRIVVSEGSNTYEGACTASEPSDDEPCRLEVEEADGIVMGSVLCEHVPNRNAATVTRHLVAPNSESAARFEAHGCRGL